jgi:RNA polymerase sigma-70 factor (ECF subfamily)
MLENLNSLVSSLPEQQRKIFQLSKEQGLSSDEIAKELNLSKRTVENHLYRALKYLKDNFAKDSLISMLFYYILLG